MGFDKRSGEGEVLTDWKNRIIGHGDEPLDEILFNPANWRIHPKAQQEALEGVLSQVGWVQDVIVNKQTGHLVDGHLRCQVAARNGEKTVPVVYVDLTPEEESLILATIDPLSAMAATDKQKLDDLLHAVQSDDERVQEMISGLAEREGLEYGKEPMEDAEPQIDRAAELNEKWRVKTGDLFRIGEHRLLCGDSTKREDVERVMGGEKARLFITDAPYGVSYADKNRFLNAVWPANRIEKAIENDHQTVPEMADLWLQAYRTIYEFCDDGCPYYIFSPQGGELMMMMMMMIRDAGFLLKHSIIWSKNQFVIGRSDYHYKHEPILYGWKDGGHKFYGEKGECSVWEAKKPHDSNLHPTTKPVELYERAIKNSSQESEIVVDIFCGSGTCLVACQNTKRLGRTIELDPNYCAVILERMQTAFPDIEIELL